MASGYPYEGFAGSSDRTDGSSHQYEQSVMHDTHYDQRYAMQAANNMYGGSNLAPQQSRPSSHDSMQPFATSSYNLPQPTTNHQPSNEEQWQFAVSRPTFTDAFSTAPPTMSSSDATSSQHHPMAMTASGSSTDSSGYAHSLRRIPSSGLPSAQPLSSGLPSPSTPFVNSTGSQLSSRSNSNTSSSANKVPRMRVNMACVHCRSRKIRCDGQQPNCKTCIRLGRTCHYETISEQENVAVREKKRKSREAKQARLEAMQQIGISTARPTGPGSSFLEQRRRSYGNTHGAVMPAVGMTSPSVLRESRSTPMNLYERQTPYPQPASAGGTRQGLAPPPLPSPLLGGVGSATQRSWQSQHPSFFPPQSPQQLSASQVSPMQSSFPNATSSFTASPVLPAEFEFGAQHPRRRGATISGFEQRVDPVQGPIWRGPIAPGMNLDPGTGMYDVAIPPAMAASQPATPDGTFPMRPQSAGMFTQLYPGAFGGGGNDPANGPQPIAGSNDNGSRLAAAAPITEGESGDRTRTVILQDPAVEAIRQGHALTSDVNRSGGGDGGGKESGSSGTPTTSGQPNTPQSAYQTAVEPNVSIFAAAAARQLDTVSHMPTYGASWNVPESGGMGGVSDFGQSQRDPSFPSSSSPYESQYPRPLSLQFTPIHNAFTANSAISSRHSSDASSAAHTFYSAVAQLALQSPARTTSSHSEQSAASVHAPHPFVHDYGFPGTVDASLTSEPLHQQQEQEQQQQQQQQQSWSNSQSRYPR